jgi:CheY-like chemotaxis protein
VAPNVDTNDVPDAKRGAGCVFLLHVERKGRVTFKWQGKTYDTAPMTGIKTGNPAMPIIYIAPEGEIFLVEIDRVEGIEIRLADTNEVRLLAERHNLHELLEVLDNLSPPDRNAAIVPAKRHALIVEDDGICRHALSRLLRLSGYNISCAATISEATMKLCDQPRWLILDLNLPDGKGTALLEQVRSNNLPIKVAITTAATDEEALSEVSRLHPDAIFHKPFDMTDVMHWLDAA